MKAAIICFFVMMALTARSQGFIDYEAVSRDYPVKCELQQQFDERLQHLEDSCGIVTERMQLTLESLIHLHRGLNKAEEAAFNDSLNAMSLAIDKLRVFAQSQLTAVQQSMDAEVTAGLSKELRRFCESRGLQFLSDQKAILIGPAEPDYTSAFIAFLNAKK